MSDVEAPEATVPEGAANRSPGASGPGILPPVTVTGPRAVLPGQDQGAAGPGAERPGPVAESSARFGRMSTGWRALYLAALAVAVTAFVYPLIWLVSAALKPKEQVFDNRLVPEQVRWQNFVDVWEAGPVLRWLTNSVLVGLMAATAVTLSSALVAFGFAYFRFRLRGPLFGLVLATMMLPGAVTMIPVYLIWNNLGMVNTQVPLWAQNLFGSAFYIFLMRQFFLGVPRELFEAARVDGCSFFGMFRRIALPLCRPALIIVFVFELQASWSDLMKPLIYLQTQEYFTMPRGLKQIVDAFALAGEYHWEIAMAASLIATLPMIAIFAVAQRYFLDGLATTAQKG